MEDAKVNRREVLVLYSGGSDSTLTAALACMRFKKVHLLTCRASMMYNLQKAKANVMLLQQKFGKDKLTHKFLDSDEIFKTIYYNAYRSDLRKFGAYLSACVCAACSLSWHVTAIIDCLKNGIDFACDGERYEDPPIWAEQMKPILERVKKLYKAFGVMYENPVYDVVRTDEKLFELGVTKERDVKLERFADRDIRHSQHPHLRWKSTQPDCHGGIVGVLYLSCHFVPLWGQTINEKIAAKYYDQKIPLCRECIQNACISKEGIITKKRL